MKTKMHQIVLLALAGFLTALAVHGQQRSTGKQSFTEIKSLFSTDRGLRPVGGTSGGSAVPGEGHSGSVEDLRIHRLQGSRVDNTGELSPGDLAKVCFKVNRDGYVSMWSLDANKNISRILPNEYMPGEGGAGVRVRRGNDYCIAGKGMTENNERMKDSSSFYFEVTPPTGKAEVFVYWSGTLKQQPPTDSFVDVDALSRSIEMQARSLRPRSRSNDPTIDLFRGGGLVMEYEVRD